MEKWKAEQGAADKEKKKSEIITWTAVAQGKRWPEQFGHPIGS